VSACSATGGRRSHHLLPRHGEVPGAEATSARAWAPTDADDTPTDAQSSGPARQALTTDGLVSHRLRARLRETCSGRTRHHCTPSSTRPCTVPALAPAQREDTVSTPAGGSCVPRGHSTIERGSEYSAHLNLLPFLHEAFHEMGSYLNLRPQPFLPCFNRAASAGRQAIRSLSATSSGRLRQPSSLRADATRLFMPRLSPAVSATTSRRTAWRNRHSGLLRGLSRGGGCLSDVGPEPLDADLQRTVQQHGQGRDETSDTFRRSHRHRPAHGTAQRLLQQCARRPAEGAYTFLERARSRSPPSSPRSCGTGFGTESSDPPSPALAYLRRGPWRRSGATMVSR